MLNEHYQNLISKVKVVSFDVFDTLLVRPYAIPSNAFLHMEYAYNLQGFAYNRIDAERKARLKYRQFQDISIDQIYECIPSRYKSLMKNELEFEKSILKAHPLNYQIYQEALRQKKQIIITTDMYLHSDFIAELLRKNGYDEFKKIYVSGEYHKAKYTGDLFRQILIDFNLSPNELLHIGDNKTADVLIPQRLGINSIWVEKPIDKLLRCNKKLKHFLCNHPSLDASIICGINAFHDVKSEIEKSDYWQKIGYSIAGPCIVGYINEIIKKATLIDADSIIFIARDGYLLQKILNKIYPNFLPSYYVFTPRSYRLKALLNHGGDPTYAKKLINMAKNEIPELSDCNNVAVLSQHRSKLIEWSKKYRKNYQKYLSKIGIKGDRILVVDGVTGQYSSQILLQAFLGKQICESLYIAKFRNANFAYSTYKKDCINPKIDEKCIVFIELFLTAPTPPCDDFHDGNPVLAKPTKYDPERFAVYKEIEKGIMEFANDYYSFFNLKMNSNFRMENLMLLIHSYIECLNEEDMMALKQIYHAPDNENFSPLYDFLIK